MFERFIIDFNCKYKLSLRMHSHNLSFLEFMAGPRVAQSPGHSRWKQWCRRRSPNTCCSKKILLLLVWQMLFTVSLGILSFVPTHSKNVMFTTELLSYSFAPLIGWLADVRFGRYEVINFASFASFIASILYFFTMLTGGGVSTLSNVLLSVAFVISNFGNICYFAAILPFITDQIIGATSNELSAVVRWFYWTENLGIGLASMFSYFWKETDVYISSTLNFVFPLAVIIISDCLCQQWLDRTHKVTNPIKLIIQVLNYTRKHSYTLRDAVPSPILMRNSPHEWTMARRNSEDPSLRRR